MVEGFYSFLGFPRMMSQEVVRKAMARGVGEGVFGYCSGSVPAVGGEGKYEVALEKVRFNRGVADDEIDLDSGSIMLPAAIPLPAPVPGVGPTPPGLGPGPVPPGPGPQARGQEMSMSTSQIRPWTELVKLHALSRLDREGLGGVDRVGPTYMLEHI